MSQITRCPHCATAFKVVADQLRISDGWVRCGHCKEVFDASEHLLISEPEQLLPDMPLQDLPAAHTPAGVHVWGSAREAAPVQEPSELPANFEAQPAAALQESAPLAQPGSAADTDTQEAHALVHEDAPDAASAPADAAGLVPLSSLLKHESFDRGQTDLAAPAQEPKGYELPGPPDSDSIGAQDDDAYVTAREPEHAPDEPMPAPGEPAAVADVDDDLVEQAELQALAPAQAEPPLAEEAALMPVQTLADAAQAGAAEAAAPDAPGFVLAARRQVFWSRPGVRGALAAMGLVFALALALQMLLQERDVISARHPALHGLLAQLCQPLQCSIQAPRRIDAVAIDSSSFVKAPHDGASYELRVGIKNNAAFAVAMPALELTLTDAQDQTLMRRVLLRNELMAPAELGPGVVWSTSVPMQVVQGASLVAGYRLLAFYP